MCFMVVWISRFLVCRSAGLCSPLIESTKIFPICTSDCTKHERSSTCLSFLSPSILLMFTAASESQKIWGFKLTRLSKMCPIAHLTPSASFDPSTKAYNSLSAEDKATACWSLLQLFMHAMPNMMHPPDIDRRETDRSDPQDASTNAQSRNSSFDCRGNNW